MQLEKRYQRAVLDLLVSLDQVHPAALILPAALTLPPVPVLLSVTAAKLDLPWVKHFSQSTKMCWGFVWAGDRPSPVQPLQGSSTDETYPMLFVLHISC